MLIYVKANTPDELTRARVNSRSSPAIAADENAASRKNVGVRVQLKLDTVQQLGELLPAMRANIVQRKPTIQETTAVSPVFRRVALCRHAAPY